MEPITLSNPNGVKVIKQANRAVCRTPACHGKELYWATIIETKKKILISKQTDGSFWQHHKDCPDASFY